MGKMEKKQDYLSIDKVILATNQTFFCHFSEKFCLIREASGVVSVERFLRTKI